MNLENVQKLVLRVPGGGAVIHQILRIPEGDKEAETAAQLLLSRENDFSFGVDRTSICCTSIGISFAGLEALKVPERYLRLFRRLAPAFTQGAVRRSVNVGDSGKSAPLNWETPFMQEHAHVLLSWHGRGDVVGQRSDEFASAWMKEFERDTLHRLDGERLGAPPGKQGEWVHFGFRDGLSEVCIEQGNPGGASDCRNHAPGALLLGEVNDAGFNSFALTRARKKVREFFHDSSFGILRKIEQHVKPFEDQLETWRVQLGAAIPGPVTTDFVKAKLCGRWPDGRQLHAGELEPSSNDLALDLAKDAKGEGCPFGSHVRRMRAAADGDGNLFDRPLQRRGVPFGPARWPDPTKDPNAKRGLLAQFFCTSIEDQFEHLLAQWAIRPPLGFSSKDRALDPFGGAYQGADAALGVPLKDRDTQWLKGFGSWTTTLGTMYAWHPGKTGLHALLKGEFVPEEDERPWL